MNIVQFAQSLARIGLGVPVAAILISMIDSRGNDERWKSFAGYRLLMFRCSIYLMLASLVVRVVLN